jgi:hypothetical protein
MSLDDVTTSQFQIFFSVPQSFYIQIFFKEMSVIDVLRWALMTVKEHILQRAEN